MKSFFSINRADLYLCIYLFCSCLLFGNTKGSWEKRSLVQIWLLCIMNILVDKLKLLYNLFSLCFCFTYIPVWGWLNIASNVKFGIVILWIFFTIFWECLNEFVSIWRPSKNSLWMIRCFSFVFIRPLQKINYFHKLHQETIYIKFIQSLPHFLFDHNLIW